MDGRTHVYMAIRLRSNRLEDVVPEFDVLEHFYPISFASNNDKIRARLQVTNDTPLDSVRRFCASVPHG